MKQRQTERVKERQKKRKEKNGQTCSLHVKLLIYMAPPLTAAPQGESSQTLMASDCSLATLPFEPVRM